MKRINESVGAKSELLLHELSSEKPQVPEVETSKVHTQTRGENHKDEESAMEGDGETELKWIKSKMMHKSNNKEMNNNKAPLEINFWNTRLQSEKLTLTRALNYVAKQKYKLKTKLASLSRDRQHFKLSQGMRSVGRGGSYKEQVKVLNSKTVLLNEEITGLKEIERWIEKRHVQVSAYSLHSCMQYYSLCLSYLIT